MMNWTSIKLIYKVLPTQQTGWIHGLRMKRTRVAGNIYEQPAEMIIRATRTRPNTLKGRAQKEIWLCISRQLHF